VGANTAGCSAINTARQRPLPYDESERLVLCSERTSQLDETPISWQNYTDWRAQQRVFEEMGVFNRDYYNLTGSGEPERIQAGQATASLFTTLRARAALGRVFTDDEDKPGGPPVVVLSHGLWQRRFAGDPQIVGKTLNLNDRGYTVIGVMPQDFHFPSRVEVWVPVGRLSDQPSWKNRGFHPGLYGVGRLKSGVTIEQARAEMDNIAAGLEKMYPDSNQGIRVRITPLLEK
jgi:putative ABC transport system permease protein